MGRETKTAVKKGGKTATEKGAKQQLKREAKHQLRRQVKFENGGKRQLSKPQLRREKNSY